MSTERQTSIPFARSRASKGKASALYRKPLTPGQMQHQSLAQNKATALEQANMSSRKVSISALFLDALNQREYLLSLRLAQFKERGQFKGGIAV